MLRYIEGALWGVGMYAFYLAGRWRAQREVNEWIIASTRLGDEQAVKASWDAWVSLRRRQRRLRWRKALRKVYSRAR